MSGYHSPTDEYAAHATGTTRINDPGDGGTIDLASKSGGFLTIYGGGTRTLPVTPQAVTLTAYASDAAVDLVDAAGNTFRLEEGDCASAISLGAGVWGGTVFPASEIDNTRQGRLGTVAIDPNDAIATTTVARGTANLELMNNWPAMGSGGFANNRRFNFDLVGRSVAIGGTDSWDLQLRDGFAIECSGGGLTRSENQFGLLTQSTDAYYSGGLASRLVWVDSSNLTGPMITSRGYGLHIKGHLNLYGEYNIYDPTTLKADATYKETGIELLGRDSAGQVPSGKIEGSLTGTKLGTIIKTLPTPFEDNADQLLLKRFVGHYVDTMFHSTNKQTLGNRFEYVDQFHATTGFKYDRGGKHWTGTHTMQAGCDYGYHLAGNDTQLFGSFEIDNLIMDGTSEADALAVFIQPGSGYCAATVNIGHLDVDYAITDRTDNPVIWCENYYGRMNIHSGTGLYARMIHVTGGTEHFHPTFYVTCGSFRSGIDLDNANIRTLFTATSDGWLNLIFINNNCVSGSGAPIYESYSATIEINDSDSVIVVH